MVFDRQAIECGLVRLWRAKPLTVHVSTGVGTRTTPTTAYAREQVIARPQRMQPIDAARGIAMLLVCVSHVRIHFAEIAPTLYFVLTSITRIATPTFLLLSGFVAAFVLSKPDRRIRLTLIDRGLFVLIAGHLLLNLDELRVVNPQDWIFGRVTVTDAIAICLMCAVALHRLSAKALATVGVCLGLISFPISMTLSFDSPVARYVGAALFDLQSEASPLIDAAIAPYLGVFLIGMALSKHSLAALRTGDFEHVARYLVRSAAIALGVVAVAIVGWIAFKSSVASETDTMSLVRNAIDPRMKLPPSPGYLLFYCGCGLLVTACCLTGRPRTLMQPLIAWASTLGRASLMCFVVQDWLLLLIPSVFQFEDFDSIAFWLLYLCCAIFVLHWIAHKWDANRCNRYLSVGLRHLKR